MKQHPDSVNRDLEDEVGDVIEHQYARKLMQPGAKCADRRGDTTTERTSRPAGANSDRDKVEDDMQQLRETSGF
jgi:hypothetical protein